MFWNTAQSTALPASKLHVFANGTEFLPQTQILWSLKPDDSNLRYFKHRGFDLTEFQVSNIKGIRHWVAKI